MNGRRGKVGAMGESPSLGGVAPEPRICRNEGRRRAGLLTTGASKAKGC